MISIPYNPTFPKARYPFARAQNGCSSWNENHPEYVRDTWPAGVSFHNACNNHDTCYYTLGSHVTTCNDRFRRELFGECDDTFDLPILLLNLDPRYKACTAIASAMYAAVVATQGKFFPQAQREQADYLAYVAELVATAQAAATFAKIAPVINLLLDD